MRGTAGFTLLELLVALSIFALVSVMAYGGMGQVLEQRARTEAQAERLKYLQLAFNVMSRDLEQMVERGIRNEFGDPVGPLVGGSGFQGVEFTRAGYPNPARLPRSELQRVAYVTDQDRVLRRTWRVLDRAQDSQPGEQVLMEGVDRFSLRFLDAGNEWHDNWPPPGQDGAAVGLPKAIEVVVESETFDRLRWLFRLPQAAQAGAAGEGAQGGEGAQQGDGSP